MGHRLTILAPTTLGLEWHRRRHDKRRSFVRCVKLQHVFGVKVVNWFDCKAVVRRVVVAVVEVQEDMVMGQVRVVYCKAEALKKDGLNGSWKKGDKSVK